MNSGLAKMMWCVVFMLVVMSNAMMNVLVYLVNNDLDKTFLKFFLNNVFFTYYISCYYYCINPWDWILVTKVVEVQSKDFF